MWLSRLIHGRCVHQFVPPELAVFGEPPPNDLLPSCGLLAIQVLVRRQSETTTHPKRNNIHVAHILPGPSNDQKFLVVLVFDLIFGANARKSSQMEKHPQICRKTPANIPQTSAKIRKTTQNMQNDQNDQNNPKTKTTN